jgi:hypothetical protein
MGFIASKGSSAHWIGFLSGEQQYKSYFVLSDPKQHIL